MKDLWEFSWTVRNKIDLKWRFFSSQSTIRKNTKKKQISLKPNGYLLKGRKKISSSNYLRLRFIVFHFHLMSKKFVFFLPTHHSSRVCVVKAHLYPPNIAAIPLKTAHFSYVYAISILYTYVYMWMFISQSVMCLNNNIIAFGVRYNDTIQMYI